MDTDSKFRIWGFVAIILLMTVGLPVGLPAHLYLMTEVVEPRVGGIGFVLIIAAQFLIIIAGVFLVSRRYKTRAMRGPTGEAEQGIVTNEATVPHHPVPEPDPVRREKKRFLSGLIMGVIIGAAGTVGIFLQWASRSKAPDVTELSLPAKPCESEEELSSFLEKYPYEIGFFAKNLTTTRTTARAADRSVSLASIVKVFCVTELYRQKHEEGLDLKQKLDVHKHGHISLQEAADLMIGKSDNAATQALAEFLGRDKVNRIPSMLGLESMSKSILPSTAVLRQTLDKRIFGARHAAAGLPQHGTARGMADYFELLLNKKVISQSVSEDLTEFFLAHPKPFSTHYAGTYNFAGKGGNLLWTRPPKHYSMMGWGLFLTKDSGDDMVLCVWGEWFPEEMPPNRQSEFLKFVTDSVISILES